MSHQDFRYDPDERFGDEDLPEEVLQALGRDEDFFPDEEEIDRLVAQIDNRIDMLQPTRITAVPWRSLVSVAAAVVLLFSLSMVGKIPTTTTDDDSGYVWEYEPLFAVDDQTELLASALTAEYDEFNDQEINVLMHDYTSSRTFDVGTGLLGDLSQDELQYLVENFDVGDLL